MVLAAEVWHYWVSFVLVGVVVLAILGTLVGYLLKVTSARYPKNQ